MKIPPLFFGPLFPLEKQQQVLLAQTCQRQRVHRHGRRAQAHALHHQQRLALQPREDQAGDGVQGPAGQQGSTAATGAIFTIYALSMAGFCALDLLSKAYYTMERTLEPLLVNAGILGCNWVLNRASRAETGSTSTKVVRSTFQI